MIVANQNITFIQESQNNSFKLEVVGRIASLVSAIILAVDTVGRALIACLATMATYLSHSPNVRSFARKQWEETGNASSMCVKCFRGVYDPRVLIETVPQQELQNILTAEQRENRIDEEIETNQQEELQPLVLTAQQRENRIREGAENIEARLAREWNRAQNQKNQEADNPFFIREYGEIGQSCIEQVEDLEVGICHERGRRPTMEDEHLTAHFQLNILGQVYPVKIFGIFDGHGGNEAARFLKTRLREKLKETLIEFNPNGLSDVGIWNALKMTFVRLDQLFQGGSGSTATIAMMLDGNLWTANVGDSRTILQNGEETIQLSEDASPDDARYLRGIANRGGAVLGGRVNGILAVARAIGDHDIGAVSARPKITRMSMADIQPNSRLILACDGIYDVASSRQIAQLVRNRAHERSDLIAKEIVNSAYSSHSEDNLSAMVVRIN